MAPRRTLPDNPSDVRLTDINRPLMPTRQDFALDSFQNRNLTSTTPYVLVGLATGIRALPRNPRRVGLQIQNKDASADLFYSLGNNLNGDGIVIPPRGSVLYDFTTPPDELYLYSGANVICLVVEMMRGFTPPQARK